MVDPVAGGPGSSGLPRRPRDPGARCGMQALSRLPGCASLSGVPLCLTQVGDVLGERGKAFPDLRGTLGSPAWPADS